MLTGGALAVALPFYGYLSTRTGIAGLWDQLVVFPATTLREVRWKPYPDFIPDPSRVAAANVALRDLYAAFSNWLRFYLPLGTYGIALVVAARDLLRSRHPDPVAVHTMIGVTLFGIALLLQALNRYDVAHVTPTSIIAVLVLCSLLPRLAPRLRLARPGLRIAAVAAILVAAGLYLLGPLRSVYRLGLRFPPSQCHSHVDRAECIYVRRDQEEAVEYIRARSRDGEAIFVGNRRHDRIFMNDVGFYFLADRPSASAYHELHPGSATTLPVQQAISAALVSAEVRWVVLVDMPESTEPNASAISSGVRHLDTFLRSNYVRIAQFGDYEVRYRDPRPGSP